MAYFDLDLHLETEDLRNDGLLITSERMPGIVFQMQPSFHDLVAGARDKRVKALRAEYKVDDGDPTPGHIAIRANANALAYQAIRGIGGIDDDGGLSTAELKLGGKTYALSLEDGLTPDFRKALFKVLDRSKTLCRDLSGKMVEIQELADEEVRFFAEGFVIGRDTPPESASSGEKTETGTTTSSENSGQPSTPEQEPQED